MRCDDARVAASLRADDELDGAAARADLEAHLAACAGCRGFEVALRRLRSHLRVEAVDRVPDIAPAVTARLRDAGRTEPVAPPDRAPDIAPALTARLPDAGSSAPVDRDPDGLRGAAGRARGTPPWARRPARRRPLAVAAVVAALAGAAAGATFVGVGTEPRAPAAADVPALVMAAQHDIRSAEVRYAVTEVEVGGTGGAGSGATRTLDADLAYRAPETLGLSVRETTAGRPDLERASGELIVDGDRWWEATTRQCSPAAGVARCPDDARTWSRSVVGREPFSTAAPVPVDLVSPVGSFALAADPPPLGQRDLAGHRALGVAVTAAQVAPILDGLSAAVELRPVHPTDPVELWLDAEHLVPLALVVRAADDPERARWAAATGATERAGDVILRIEATAARINGPVGGDAVTVPDREPSSSVDGGFRPTALDDPAVAAVPVPATLPEGFEPHRSGTVTAPGGPAVGVRSWSDGRARLTVRATADWPGGRLFGDLGPDVRPVDLGTAGVGYASADGSRIALHTADLDAVVSGSLPADDLREVAAGLDLLGVTVPDRWAEAATATVAEAAVALPGLLTARSADGFGAPAVRVDGATVTQAHAGPGQRGFTLTQRRSAVLPPPATGDEAGIEVRGTAGRYSRERGELEWVERGVTVSLRSHSLGLGELLAIAERLEPA